MDYIHRLTSEFENITWFQDKDEMNQLPPPKLLTFKGNVAEKLKKMAPAISAVSECNRLR